MKKQATIAALLFGAVVASGSAFAAGKAPNDGGPIDAPSGPSAKPLYNSTSAIPAPAHYGKALDDGGSVDNVNGAPATVTAIPTPPHYGKALDDGGM